MCINNTYNTSIGETPFYMLYGYDSPTISLVSPKINYRDDDLSIHLKKVSEIREHCRSTLLKAQEKYTKIKNIKRKEKPISIGDRVFARLKKHYTHKKLNYPISGPFIVDAFKGNALVLKAVSTEEKYTVHPDEIILKTGNQGDVGELTQEKKNKYLSPDAFNNTRKRIN